MSRMAADTTLINTAIRASVSQALRNFLVMTGGLIMMIVSSPALSMMVIMAIPVIVLPLVFYGRIVRRLSKDAQDVLAGLNQYGAEALVNMRLVQAFGAERHMTRRFEAGNEKAVEASLVRTKARAILTAVAIFLVMASIVLILWYGAHDVASGEMSPGALVQFMLYAVFAGGSMGSLSEVWGEVAQAAGAAERLSDYLDAEADVVEAVKPLKPALPFKGEITFEDVRFSYPTRGDEPVLQDVSFHIKPGERIAIVGASGAGKSTIFQLLLRFYDPDAGRILIDGAPVNELSLHDLRSAFALVPQEPTLFDATIEENIAFADETADQAAVISAAEAAQADEFIKGFAKGYETLVGEGGQSLSGGQRQRVALARAILRDAPILLLDEATSALDTGSEEKVQQALLEIMKGRTSLIIAHRLSTVKDADRILVFDKGRFVEEGRHADLLEKGGLYAELQRTQLDHDEPHRPAIEAEAALS
jgi:ATP-binding cassette subfamily B protein